MDELQRHERVQERGDEMKKMIAMLMLAAMLISFSFSKEANASNTDRFKLIQGTPYCDVIVDTETGVEYAFSTGAYNHGSMTVLVDETGNPLIWKGE